MVALKGRCEGHELDRAYDGKQRATYKLNAQGDQHRSPCGKGEYARAYHKVRPVGREHGIGVYRADTHMKRMK